MSRFKLKKMYKIGIILLDVLKKSKMLLLAVLSCLFLAIPIPAIAADLATIYQDIKELYPQEISTMNRYGASDGDISEFVCAVRDELVSLPELTTESIEDELVNVVADLYVNGAHVSVFDALANGWGLDANTLMKAYDEGGASSVAALLPESLKEIGRRVLDAAANFAVVEGYVSIYLGEPDTGLHELLLQSVKQESINEAYKSFKFKAKKNDLDEGVEYTGSRIFVPDEGGNLAVKGAENRVAGNLRLNIMDLSNTVFRIGEAGYISKSVNFSLLPGQNYSLGNEISPLVLYPGDIGSIVSNQGLALIPDGKINNIDFSAWLKIYRDKVAEKASELDLLRADYTKNGTIDNIDFSLWLCTYKKLISMKN